MAMQPVWASYCHWVQPRLAGPVGPRNPDSHRPRGSLADQGGLGCTLHLPISSSELSREHIYWRLRVDCTHPKRPE